MRGTGEKSGNNSLLSQYYVRMVYGVLTCPVLETVLYRMESDYVDMMATNPFCRPQGH